MSEIQRRPHASNCSFWHSTINYCNCGALVEEVDPCDAELTALRAEIREWLCDRCNTVYPGPPREGFSCVVCPNCGGSTGPKVSVENRRLRADKARLEAALAEATRERDAARADGELASLELASLRATLAKDGAIAAWVEDLDNWVAMNLKFNSVRQCDESGHWHAETEIAEGGGRGLVEAILDVRKWHDSAPSSDAARTNGGGE